ncbi:DnaJ domain-containing protein [Kineosporia sp. J2-2]|uniref:DnaJ domain-containing protein n=1 Tax=Kineosporia corallincola TaxID=2835133 RepID=A0ABS5TKQ8_9ACTN|nr:DnaJ domain-containing protein [Kineosporia corallincola]MBT0771694.1 DnaJ domain-containing protein [Kineosporia corallincola]
MTPARFHDLAGGSAYQVLGVAESATPGEINRGYRRRMRALHPDTRPRGYEEAQVVSTAHRWLTHHRPDYDRYVRERRRGDPRWGRTPDLTAEAAGTTGERRPGWAQPRRDAQPGGGVQPRRGARLPRPPGLADRARPARPARPGRASRASRIGLPRLPRLGLPRPPRLGLPGPPRLGLPRAPRLGLPAVPPLGLPRLRVLPHRRGRPGPGPGPVLLALVVVVLGFLAAARIPF